mmetsp:Transcript_74225/g.172170  ORF Transcript_74225/g.172170 Transcript_74225/m.172170 type:complete len:216 (-) Transcript_74225:746-1393(-)
MSRPSSVSMCQFMKMCIMVFSASSPLAFWAEELALLFWRVLRLASLVICLFMNSSASRAFLAPLTSSIQACSAAKSSPPSLAPAILVSTPLASLLFFAMNCCIFSCCALTCTSKSLAFFSSSRKDIQAWKTMLFMLSSFAAPKRIIDFFALAFWAALRLPMRCCTCSTWPLADLASFSSWRSLIQTRKHSDSSRLSEASAERVSTLRTLLTCAAL